MIINVTQKNIDEGCRETCSKCPKISLVNVKQYASHRHGFGNL